MDTPWVKSSYSFSNGNCLEWRKSTFSAAGNCIEVAPSVQVRDSKLGDASPIVRFSPAVWQSFTEGLKNS